MLLQQWVIINIKMYYWIINVWHSIDRMQSKHHRIGIWNQQSFIVLMTKNISKTMDMMG